MSARLVARRLARWSSAPLLAMLPWIVSAACPEANDSEAQFAASRRLQAESKLDDAVACQQRGIALAGATLRAAQERQYLAELLEKGGKFSAAVEVLKQTLPQMEKLSGPDSEATGDLVWSLGWTEYLAGSFGEAEGHLRTAQAIYVSRLGPRHIKIAKTLNALGLVLRDRVQYEDAEVTLSKALDVAANGDAPDDKLRAMILNSTAGLWYYRGDYRRALENFKFALQIQERVQGEMSLDVGKLLNNVGAVYEEVGEYESARTYYSRALTIQEKLLGANHPTVAAPICNLAVLAYAQGDWAGAEPLFRRALQIYESALGKEHPLVADVLVKYGALKQATGQSAAARDLLERALQIQETAYGPDSNWVALALNELGPVYQALRQSARAKEILIRSIGITAAGDEPQVLLIAYGRYADVLAANGESAAAAFYGKFAVNLAQQIRSDMSALGQTVQTSYLASRQHHYRNLADRLIELGRLAEAEQVMTMLKEEEYFDFVRVAVRAADGGATRADFSATERRYADEVAQALKLLAANAVEFRTTDDHAATKESRRAALGRQQNELRAMLATTARTLTQKVTPHPTRTAQRLRQDVGSGTALVRYLVTANRVRTIVATQSATVDLQVDIDVARLNRLVFELRQALQDPKSDPLPMAKELHRLLIAPLAPVLARSFSRDKVTSLRFELDGTLRYVPFAALHDGKSFLVEQFAIEQRTLAAEQHTQVSATQQLAGFGVSKAVGGFPALPAVEAELDRIVRRGPNDRDGVVPGVVLMDEAFTESSLRDVLKRDYSLVHLASHFVFRPGPLSDSYLLLGGGEPLTLERFRDGNLSLANVRLLTLSACSTAMGESAENGGELESFGVLAQRLGAREVLASLWPVADRSTSMLMLNLYRSLAEANLPTAQALRRAQLNLLHGDPRFAPYAHPFYWAPFIVMSSAASSR